MYVRKSTGSKRGNSEIIVKFEKYWKLKKCYKANYVIEHDFAFKRSYL